MRVPVKLPSQKFLKECFLYERSTGNLFWRKRPRKHFSSDREFKRWNTRYAGLLTFQQVIKDGHLRGNLGKIGYLAHRVIWKIVTGKEPPDNIDHKDRNEQNNRWKNLREATGSQNCTNKGCAGVSQRANTKWRARVSFGGKRVHVGDFDSRSEAIQARRIKNKELHGEFAP